MDSKCLCDSCFHLVVCRFEVANDEPCSDYVNREYVRVQDENEDKTLIEYMKRLRTMKPSEFAEEVLGIKLLWYQKILMDVTLVSRMRFYICPRQNVDLRLLEACRRILYDKTIKDTFEQGE